MAWIFRKRKKLFPGVHLNYGSSGLSLNVGVPGASVTLGKDGVYANTGLPGMGIRNRRKITATTETQDSEDIQITEKDIKRAGCFRNIIYDICYLFSYAIIITLWIVTGLTYSSENYYYLIPGVFALLFIINTIRLHLFHHRINTTSSLIFPIILSMLFILSITIAGVAFFFEKIPIGWSLCLALDCILMQNVYYCFKFRNKNISFNVFYYVCYLFNYAIIIALWVVTEHIFSLNKYYSLIPSALTLLFVTNVILLHYHHRRDNVSSTLIFPIVVTSLCIIVVSLLGVIFYFVLKETTVWSLCVILDGILVVSLWMCFKYRAKESDSTRKIESTRINNNSVLPPSVELKTANEVPVKPIIKNDATIEPITRNDDVPVESIRENVLVHKRPTTIFQTTSNTEITSPSHKPAIDFAKEGVLFFSQNNVKKELEKAYSLELIEICAYVVRVEKCVLSDIQAELGITYQRVLEAVKILEKARIIKVDGICRKVMTTDETTAIRLLLRYASENFNK